MEERSTIHGLSNLLRMPPRRWLLAFEAAKELVQMKLLVARRSPAQYAHLLGAEENPSSVVPSVSELKEVVWAVHSVGSYAPSGINCLPRALAMQRMLMRRGTQGVIRFGVKKVGGELRAHAWLVLGGRVLVGALPDLADYALFDTWPER